MSKFDGILSLKPNVEVKKTKTTSAKKQVNAIVEKAPKIETPSASSAVVASVAREEKSKRVGKRSHPDYTQITAYVKKNTHEDVMRKIYKRQELSELLEELLTEWLQRTQ